MEKQPSFHKSIIPVAPMSPDESLNSNLTAAPHDAPDELIDYGDMNERDARLSGYTDSEGHAVSMARKDVKGHPTNALTDIGAGRSSVVRHR